MKYKYAIHQYVKVNRSDKSWFDKLLFSDDCEFTGVITSYCNILLNGQRTYAVRKSDGSIVNVIVEKDIEPVK